jgi:hypothetical protein
VPAGIAVKAKVASLGLVRLHQQPLPYRSDRAATVYPQRHQRQVENEPPWREDAQVDWANRSTAGISAE